MYKSNREIPVAVLKTTTVNLLS